MAVTRDPWLRHRSMIAPASRSPDSRSPAVGRPLPSPHSRCYRLLYRARFRQLILVHPARLMCLPIYIDYGLSMNNGVGVRPIRSCGEGGQMSWIGAASHTGHRISCSPLIRRCRESVHLMDPSQGNEILCLLVEARSLRGFVPHRKK